MKNINVFETETFLQVIKRESVFWTMKTRWKYNESNLFKFIVQSQ